MADVLERALDPRVAPRRILHRHPHNKLTNFDQDTASSGFPGVRPLPGDQLAMPPQQRVRCRDRRDRPQGRTAETEGSRRPQHHLQRHEVDHERELISRLV
jgi:hypothetical protein